MEVAMTLQDKKSRYWRQHIDALGSSNQSVADYCRKHKMNQSTLYAWKIRLSDGSKPKSKQMIPVKVVAERATNKASFVRVVLRDGTIVESDGDLSAVAKLADMLRRLRP